VVSSIAVKSPASNQEIKKGDIIESINGVIFKDMKFGAEEIPYRLIGEVGSRVELVIVSGTETRKVKLMRVNEEDFK